MFLICKDWFSLLKYMLFLSRQPSQLLPFLKQALFNLEQLPLFPLGAFRELRTIKRNHLRLKKMVENKVDILSPQLGFGHLVSR